MFKLRFAYLAVAIGLAGAACTKDNDSRKNAENAAEAVRDKTDELKSQADDLRDTAKDNSKELADQTADNAKELKEDVKDVADKMARRADDTSEKATDSVDDLKDPTTALNKDAIALRDANKEFEYQRIVRMEALRVTHSVVSTQPLLINAVAASVSLVDKDRAKINESLHLMQMRLDESANLIQSMTNVDAQHWTERERSVSDAMNKLEDAREAAWDALDDAERVDRTSMR